MSGGENRTPRHYGDADLPCVGSAEVSDPASIKAAAARVGEHLGGSGLTLLINNAAIIKLNSLDNETLEDMTQVYTTNTIGPLLLGQVRVSPDLGCSREAQRAGVTGSWLPSGAQLALSQ